jgi:hypothetical protein
MSINKKSLIGVVVIAMVLSITFSGIAIAWPPNLPPYDEVCVLVIGISLYEDPYWNTGDSAVRDANYFYWKMLDNWPQCSQEIVLLTDSDATYDNIKDAFDDVFANADENTLAIVHWGGHGGYGTNAPDYAPIDENGWADGILLTYDGYGVTDDELGVEIGAITAGTKVVILDSCHMEEFDSELDLDNTIAIMSTEYDEDTHPYAYPPVYQMHKPFSYYFHRASDTNSDGVLTIEEAFIGVPFIDTYG